MAIEIRRLTFKQQVSRQESNRGRALAMEIRGPKGYGRRAADIILDLPSILAAKDVEVKFYTPLGMELDAAALIGKTVEEMDNIAAEIDKLSQSASKRLPQMDASEVEVLLEELKMNDGEVTTGLFERVMQGSKPLDDHDGIRVALADPEKEGSSLNLVSYSAARSFVRRFNALTGRHFKLINPNKRLLLPAGSDNWVHTEFKFSIIER